ncbi:MAG: DUF6527 family protein [Chitinophagales bacterium]
MLPSVWRIQGCKSHFFVKENKIDWVIHRHWFKFNRI